MATLTSRKVSDTYKDLLQVSNSNSGITGSLTNVEDGEGTASVLQLSSAAVNITGAGTLQYAGTAITATAAEINVLDGYTGDVNDLNYAKDLRATGVTATEFDYLDGVTSNIQTQLDSKATGFRTVEVDTNGDDSANETLGASETLRFKKGSNVTLSESSGVITISATDTNTQLSNAEVRTAVEAASDSNVFTDADHSKLDGIASGATANTGTVDTSGTPVDNDFAKFTDANTIEGRSASEMRSDLNVEDGADVTDATNVTAAGALMDSELTSIADVKALDQSVVSGATPTFTTTNFTDATNKRFMTDAQETKLDSVESNADVTDASNVTAAGALMDSEVSNLSFVKGLTSGISNGNVLVANSNVSDNDFLKIDGTSVEGRTAAEVRSDLNVEDGADVTDTANVTSAGALMDSEVDADLKTFSLPANTTISTFGKSIVDDADAAAVRTTIGVDPAGTDNSTNVSLSGSLDYLTISGQTITRNAIDLAADVTGTLPVANGGTGATSLNDLITLGTHTTGNYVAGIAGTSNEITVSGSGSESASVTISLPDDVTIGRDLVVTRNLTVNGTTTTINTDEVNIADNQIVLNSDFTGSSPTANAGIEVERGTQTNKSLQWNETDDKWTVGSETFVAGTFEGNLAGTVNTATQGTIDHDSLANFVANEHIDHTGVTLTAGAGLTGGGTIAANRTFAVGAGTGIAVNANDVAIDIAGTTLNNSPATGDLILTSDSSDSDAIKAVSISDIVALAPQGDITAVTAGAGLTGGGNSSGVTLTVGAGTGISVSSTAVSTDDSAIVHDDLSGFVANEHIDHSSVSITAGNGLTGGGTIASTRTVAVGEGTGIKVNANDVAVDIQGTSLVSSLATGDLLLISDSSDSNTVKATSVADVVGLAPQGDITAVVAGTNLSGGGNGPGSVTLNVDDAFLVNDANDTTTGTITAAGFTTAGNLTLGGHAVNDIDLGGEFVDADDHLMTSAAINDRITSFGYTTNTGDITAVVAGTGLSGGATSGSATLNLDINGLGLAPEVTTSDIVAIYDASATAVKKITVNDIVALSSSGDITGVTAGAGLTGGGSSGGVSLAVGAGNLIDVQANQVDVDLSELTDGTADIVGSEDELVYLDDGAQKRKLVSEIKLSQFNNDSGFTANTGDITAVVAGSGLSGGSTSGSATVNVDIQGTTLAGEIATNDLVLISDTSNSNAIRSIAVSEIAGLAPQGDITSVVAGTGLTGGGSSSDVTLNVAAGNLIDVQANQVDVDLSELTTSTSDGDGDFFAVIDSSNNQKKLTKGNINISGFNNDSGFTTNTGDITGVTAGDGLSGGGSSGGVTVNLDIDGQTLLNEAPASADTFIIYDDSASAFKKVAASNVVGGTGDITAVVAGSGLTGGASSGSATLNVGAGTLIDVSSTAVNVDLSELSTSTSNADGDHFVVVDDSNNQKKLTKGNINISGFNNDSGFTTNTGDITAVVAGDGMTGGATSGSATVNVVGGTGITANANDVEISIDDVTLTNSVTTSDTLLIYDASATAVRQASIADFPFTNNSGDITAVSAGTGLSGGGSSGSVSLAVDLSELTDMTADVNSSQDELIILDNGADRRKLISEIPLSAFDNDSGFTSNSGDITGVTAGNALTGGGSSGAITINHEDTSSQSSVNNSGRTYIQDITLDTYGHVTGLTSATETVTNTDTNTNQLTTFQVEDGDGTEVTISHGKELKFREGGGIDINFTDTSTGSDADPFDLTFTVSSQTDNNFTDADHSKLDGIEASADVTDTSNVTAAGALMDSECTNLAAVKGINQALTTSSDVTFNKVISSTIDVAGDLTLDADGADVILKDGGTEFGRLTNFLGGLTLKTGSSAANGLIFSADGTTMITGGSIQMSGGFVLDGNTITGVDDSGEFTNDDAHIMTSAGIEDKILGYGYTTNTGNVTSGSTVDFNNLTCDQIGVNVSANGTDGRIDAGNDIVAFSSSDKRLKENIKPLDNALDKVSKISGVEFDWKPLTKEEKKTIHGNEGHDVGVIAQEIEEVLPEVVQTRDTGYKAVKYEKIVPLLIEAIKELKEEIEELKK